MEVWLMKRLLIILILASAVSGGCAAVPTGTLYGSAQGLAVLDMFQTFHIAKDDRWIEINPILGKHPSTTAVAAYMGSWMVANHLIYRSSMPERAKRGYFWLFNIVQIGATGNNFRNGVGISHPFN
jgi:hypothetical protein